MEYSGKLLANAPISISIFIYFESLSGSVWNEFEQEFGGFGIFIFHSAPESFANLLAIHLEGADTFRNDFSESK